MRINLTRAEGLQVMRLWQDHHLLLVKLCNELVDAQSRKLGRLDTEWEMARQTVELVAKRQAYHDLLSILESRYE